MLGSTIVTFSKVFHLDIQDCVAGCNLLIYAVVFLCEIVSHDANYGAVTQHETYDASDVCTFVERAYLVLTIMTIFWGGDL